MVQTASLMFLERRIAEELKLIEELSKRPRTKPNRVERQRRTRTNKPFRFFKTREGSFLNGQEKS